MPKTIRFDHSINCFFIRWTGRVHVEDVISYFREIVRHTEFRSGMNALHPGPANEVFPALMGTVGPG